MKRYFLLLLLLSPLLFADDLSIAKTASAAMSLRCRAFITVMETAQMRNGDDPADARNLPRVWTLLVEPQMGCFYRRTIS